jgi:hypothetical protein
MLGTPRFLNFSDCNWCRMDCYLTGILTGFSLITNNVSIFSYTVGHSKVFLCEISVKIFLQFSLGMFTGLCVMSSPDIQDTGFFTEVCVTAHFFKIHSLNTVLEQLVFKSL